MATPPSPPPTIRTALPPDLPAIVSVITPAMSSDPIWDWRFPHRHDYPADHLAHTASQYERYISPTTCSDYTVTVAEIPNRPSSDQPDDVHTTTIAAVGVWDFSLFRNNNMRTACLEQQRGPRGNDEPPPSACRTPPHTAVAAQRRDIDPQHQQSFIAATSKAKKRFFDDVYGREEQVHLQLLCTHPAYVRRGLGREMVAWGIGVARGEGVVTLMASRAGVGLYEGLGFRRVGWVGVGVEEGVEAGAGEMGLGAMVLDLRGGRGEV